MCTLKPSNKIPIKVSSKIKQNFGYAAVTPVDHSLTMERMVPVFSFLMFSATGFVELSNSENSTSSPTVNSTGSASLTKQTVYVQPIMANLGQVFKTQSLSNIWKSRDITNDTKVRLMKKSHLAHCCIWLCGMDTEEGRSAMHRSFWNVGIQKTTENPLDTAKRYVWYSRV